MIQSLPKRPLAMIFIEIQCFKAEALGNFLDNICAALVPGIEVTRQQNRSVMFINNRKCALDLLFEIARTERKVDRVNIDDQ